MNNTIEYAIACRADGTYVVFTRRKLPIFRVHLWWSPARVAQCRESALALVATHKKHGLFFTDVEVVV